MMISSQGAINEVRIWSFGFRTNSDQDQGTQQSELEGAEREELHSPPPLTMLVHQR